MHSGELPQAIVQRLRERRRKLHLFETIEPAATARVVIDMQRIFLEPGALGRGARRLARHHHPVLRRRAHH